MKKFKQIISVVLCAALCLSAFAISAQAKSAKKYVKSISVKSKAAITIPADKKTASKSFKVTVKVNAKASKKFTAKSGNTAVATVKVSGSKIKVTAKKAGTAKIKVTTKAKGKKGKKLSKTLTVTVKKNKKSSSSTPSATEKKAYISEHYNEFDLKYSEHGNSKALRYGFDEVTQYVMDYNEKAVYSAVVADKKVADTGVSKDGENIVYSTGVGVTKADIYEQFPNSKKTFLGTITITVSPVEESADISYDALAVSGLHKEAPIWLKFDFDKTTFALTDAIKGALNNEELGTDYKDSDYTLEYSIVNPEVASIDDKGVIKAIKNGETSLTYKLKFKDGSEDFYNLTIKVTGKAIEKVDGYTIDNVRDYIVGVNTPVELSDGTKVPMINFDNAATTPAFKAVQDAVNAELEMYGSIGRGFSQKSNHSTDVYNGVREKVLEFLHADPEAYTCFYVNSTTDGLNKLASALITSKDDVVLTTRIEHHANDLSWRERCKVIYAEVDKQGRVIYDDLEKLLKENKVKILSISAASNVTGYVNDVHRAAKLAHKYGAEIVVDGAQIVAHRTFSMLGDPDDPADDIDYIAFSAHKMYSPYGGGAVVGITSTLNKHMPTFYGGGTIKVVGDDWAIFKEAPAVYEAGSPNYPGVVGLGKAIDVLTTIGMDKIQAHEKVLNRKAIDGILKLDKSIVYGDTENIDDRVGVVTFNFSDISTYHISQALSELGGVATRRGAFCAHPYVWRLMGIDDETAKGFENCTDAKTAGMVRLSFGIYNNEDEVESFLALMPKVMAEAKYRTENSDSVPEY